jgi:hypothetical protein
MSQPNLFEYRHFKAEIILLCLRRYSLSYRDLEEMRTERGLSVGHPPILQKGCCTIRYFVRLFVRPISGWLAVY